MRYFIVLFFLFPPFRLISQQFQIEWDLSISQGTVRYLGDIDNDGIGEFYSESGNKIFNGLDGSLKYSFRTNLGSIPYWHLSVEGNVTAGDIDFDNNGVNDLYTYFSTYQINIIDPETETTIFTHSITYNTGRTYFRWIGDFDNDNIIEIAVIDDYSNGNTKMSVYSTGVNVTSLNDGEKYQPKNFRLIQNFPNPFNPTTTIKYEVSEPGLIQIVIYDALGSMVTRLINREQDAGIHSISWDGTNQFGNKVASGTYYYQLVSGDMVTTKKMIYLK